MMMMATVMALIRLPTILAVTHISQQFPGSKKGSAFLAFHSLLISLAGERILKRMGFEIVEIQATIPIMPYKLYFGLHTSGYPNG